MRNVTIMFLVILLAQTFVYAQQNVGRITGTVHDTTGGVIPQADVVAVNEGTALTTGVTTDTSGLYIITLLPIGSYTLTVTHAGFQKFRQTEIRVISGVTATVDVELTVGAVTTAVTVTGAAPALDTEATNISTSRTREEIEALPIILPGQTARSALSFAHQLAGVNSGTPGAGGFGQDFLVVSRSNINGTYGGQQGYQIDGLEAGMGEAESASDFVSPIPDAVDEVQVVANADASQGFNTGISLNLTLKSGTNNLHGSVFDYLRNDALESRTFFASKVSPDKEDEGGFVIGGPVVIPKVYNGKNKTFFFAALDIFRYRSETLGTIVTLPTALMRQGNFSQLLGSQVGTDVLGRPIFQGEIYDPSTTRPDGQGGFIRDPYAFNGQLNVMDPAKLSPVSLNFNKAFAALPNLPGTTNNWVGSGGTSSVDKDQILLKFDHIINARHRASFAYESNVAWFFGGKGVKAGFTGHWWISGPAGYLLPQASQGFIDDRGEYRMRFNYVWNLSSNKLLDFRAGVTRNPQRIEGKFPFTGSAATWGRDQGIKGTLDDPGTPYVTIAGQAGFGTSFVGILHQPAQKVPLNLDLSWMKGSHSLKFGASFIAEPYSMNTTGGGGPNSGSAAGIFNFATRETSLPGVSTTGWGYASFLAGTVDSGTVGTRIDMRTFSGAYGLYAQDQWHVNSKLTLSYGLRWELFIPFSELQNKITSFDPTIPNPAAGGLLGAQTFYGTGAGRNGLHLIAPYYYKAFAPRVGLAYRFTPKTVGRISYGISNGPSYSKYLASRGPTQPTTGWNFVQTAVTTDNGVTPAFNWTNGFPLNIPALPNFSPSLANGLTLPLVDRNPRPEMVENVGAEVGTQLGYGIALRLAYVGTFGHRIPGGGENINAMPLADRALGGLLTASITSPQAVAAGIRIPYPGFTGSVAQALRPYPQYVSIPVYWSQYGTSSYSALQAEAQKHFGNGLAFLGAFTWSKMMTNDELGINGGGGGTTVQYPRGIFNTAKALQNNDRPLMLNLSWAYDVPFGSGKHYLPTASGPLNKLVGGWRVSGIQNYWAGNPIRVTSTATIPGGFNAIWPVLVPGVSQQGTPCSKLDPGNPALNRYINPAAFTDAAPFALGNVSQLHLRNCHTFWEDLGLDKDTPLSERLHMKFGMYMDNVFNRHLFSGFGTNIDVPTSFGKATASIPGRSVQFYMKLEY